MPDYILTDLGGNEADTQFDPAGTAFLKAAGRAIPVTASAYDSAPAKVEDATLFAGHGSVAVAAGPVRTKVLSSTTAAVRLTIKAWVGNTHTLYVGGSTVTADQTSATTSGFQLSPGEAVTFGVDDVSAVYIHGTAAEGASFFYET
jgi:hypothetical protein